ncbi:MAG: inositol monophosphatase family protein [Candidatus Dasytiphilus stammeri]
MHPILNIAIRAARLTGDLIYKNSENLEITQPQQQSDHILYMMKKIEKLVMNIIHKCYPEHVISFKRHSKFEFEIKNHEVQWIINPLDGITNFIKKIPHWAVSIAIIIKKRTEIAVIYDFIRNELFTAVRGQGTKLNGYRMRTSKVRNLNGMILATDFSFINNPQYYSQEYLKQMAVIFSKCADCRASGSTALDLAYIASGRLDGYFKIGFNQLYFSAGELLIREAGGVVTCFRGCYQMIIYNNMIAGNVQIVNLILKLLSDE